MPGWAAVWFLCTSSRTAASPSQSPWGTARKHATKQHVTALSMTGWHACMPETAFSARLHEKKGSQI